MERLLFLEHDGGRILTGMRWGFNRKEGRQEGVQKKPSRIRIVKEKRCEVVEAKLVTFTWERLVHVRILKNGRVYKQVWTTQQRRGYL